MDQQTLPPVNDSIGPKNLYIVTPILGLGVLLYSVRIYTRVVPTYKLNSSDYTNTVAVLAGVISYACFASAISNGFGRHSYYISPESSVKILRYLFIVTVTGIFTSVFARVSVGCLLLQLATSNMWKIILWASIAFHIASLITTATVQLAQCHPIWALWETVPGGHCFSQSVIWTLGYVFTGMSIVGDLIFVIMPIFLIWRLSRSVVERCLVSLLMALGLFATGVGVFKIIYSTTFDRTSPDGLRAMMPVFLWCRLEEVVLILASSAPLLKVPIENMLHRLGLPKFQNRTSELNSFHWNNLRSNQVLDSRPASQQGVKTNKSKLESGEASSLVA